MPEYVVEELFRGVWCVQHHDGLARAYIVRTYPGALVVDAGPLDTASGLMAGLQAARVGLSSVRALLLTGSDVSRVAGARRLLDRSGTTAYGAPAHRAPVLDALGGHPLAPLERGQRFEDVLEVASVAERPEESTTFLLPRDAAWFRGRASNGAPRPPAVEIRHDLPANGSA